jgi:hypothetical protein
MVAVLASLNLAIFTMGGLGILFAFGTLVESKYDAWTANKLVWNSPWMVGLCSLLVVNLAAVILSRIPWKSRHLPFLSAHVGIIIFVFGAGLTQLAGIEGRVRLEGLGAEGRSIVLRDEELQLFNSADGVHYERVQSIPIDRRESLLAFLRPRPTMKTQDLEIDLLQTIPYAVPEKVVKPTTAPQSGAAIQILLSNKHTQKAEWIVQANKLTAGEAQLGPLRVTLGGAWTRSLDQSEIRLVPKGAKELEYTLFNKGAATAAKTGKLKEGEVVPTEWNGLSLRILIFHEQAEVVFQARSVERANGQSRTAVKIKAQGQESYLFLNHQVKIFTESQVYLLTLVKKEIPLSQSLRLMNFTREFYPGSMRPKAYESQVKFGDGSEAVISMNSPYEQGSYRFYQSGLEFLPNGRFAASILSVSTDPGRYLKYGGALLMCFGIVSLFIFKAGSRPRKASENP